MDDLTLAGVTWQAESALNFSRKGMLGCTDTSDGPPVTEWTRDLPGKVRATTTMKSPHRRPSGLTSNGEGTRGRALVGFGRRFWAFDGDAGASGRHQRVRGQRR